ncbi:hypothetical protein I552_0392 [Mycobacterium xenopi 3993]|nr:hypothetical protein I552_0392 [Mycobacterium xenopi 3993]
MPDIAAILSYRTDSPGYPPILSMMRDRAGNASGENRFVAGRIG